MRIYTTVIARASKNYLEKISDFEYKIKVTSPPVNGKANDVIIKLIAKYFSVAPSRVSIVGGKTTKRKIIDIL